MTDWSLIQNDNRRQWTQLLTLTAVHFIVDCFPGLMHTVLPAFQEQFGLSVASGAVLLTVFLVSANGIQVLIGYLRAEEERPLFLYIGLVLVCVIALFSIVPADGSALFWLCLFSVLCGVGVGMTHQEGLKAIHRMDRISSTVSSTVFMAGGVAGFAFSGWVSTYLFERHGFWSLAPFCIASLLVLLAVWVLRIRLAVERDEPSRKASNQQVAAVSFWLVMAVATLSACSSQLVAWIVPQRLDEMGAALSAGGVAVAAYSLGGGLGGIVMSRFASRRGELNTIRWMLMAGIPLAVVYVFCLRYPWSPVLVFGVGFLCFGAYPLMVSLARHCEGPSLGHRMGLIVGGIWLIACMLPMILGPVAEQFGAKPIVYCIPAGFILSLLLVILKSKKRKRL